MTWHKFKKCLLTIAPTSNRTYSNVEDGNFQMAPTWLIWRTQKLDSDGNFLATQREDMNFIVLLIKSLGYLTLFLKQNLCGTHAELCGIQKSHWSQISSACKRTLGSKLFIWFTCLFPLRSHMLYFRTLSRTAVLYMRQRERSNNSQLNNVHN